LFVLAIYLLIGFQYAALTPRWQVPDEPAHYNYIRYLVDNRSLPTLDPGEYQQGYLGELTSKKFPPELSIDSLQYESWQPPLYYLLAAPIYLIFNGALLPLRLFSLSIGVGVIVFTYLAVHETLHATSLRETPLPLIAAGFVAFIPQHIAMMSGINNDSLSELIMAFGLWFILKLNNKTEIGNQDLGLLGLLVGLAFLTKSHAYLLAPVAALMLFLRWRRSILQSSQFSNSPITNYQSLFTQFLIVFIPALLLGSLFWGRNLAIYGWPDFMASIRHDQVVADQPRTKDWIAQFGTQEVARRFFQTTFQSFWGQFGWMGVPMPERYYWALLGLTFFLILGFLIALWRIRRLENWRIGEFSKSLILIFSLSLIFGLYFYYNLTFVQHQGRYLFPALVPLSTAVAVSLWQWGEIASRLTKRNIGWIIPVVALTSLAALSVFALYRFILPALA
jgi:4-amino-4-deoxy-L-arabinose transferase-like glycosyltransferase